MADFTTYWLPKQVQDNLGTAINHIADNNLGHVKPGDTVWIVNVRRGDLLLIGRIVAAEVMDKASARRRLGYSPWDARHQVLCAKRDAELARRVPLGKVAWDLTFESDASEKLTPRAGKVYGQQVRRARRLTPAAAAILRKIWGDTSKISIADFSTTDRGAFPDVDDDVPIVGREGKMRLYKHLRRERSREIVIKKKRRVKQDTGRLRCEACGFDFEAVFGPSLEDFCEVHHTVPLGIARGVRKTRLEDLAVLCANCHRAIHRILPEMPTVPELADMIRRNR
jgi:hypothetical protein